MIAQCRLGSKLCYQRTTYQLGYLITVNDLDYFIFNAGSISMRCFGHNTVGPNHQEHILSAALGIEPVTVRLLYRSDNGELPEHDYVNVESIREQHFPITDS